MNLEEELAMLESQSTIMQQPNNNPVSSQELIDGVNQIVSDTLTEAMNNQKMMNNNQNIINNNQLNNQTITQPQTQQIQGQPAMVNVNQAAQQVSQFNLSNLEFDINKPQENLGSKLRLAGQANETFRIHLLPVSPSKVHIHYHSDGQQSFNFICLKDSYASNMPEESCCRTHGWAKARNIIPVIVYPTVQNNINALIPGAAPELKVLVINDKKLEEIRQAASTVLGTDPQHLDLSQVDITAKVDNPQYKSHIFNCSPTSLLSQVQNFLPGLMEQWKAFASNPENLCGLAGRLITREYYDQYLSNYNYQDHLNKQDTPIQGAAPGSYTFTTPMYQPQGGFQQPYQPTVAAGVPSQPFYNGNQSTTFGGQFNNIDQSNPWG